MCPFQSECDLLSGYTWSIFPGTTDPAGGASYVSAVFLEMAAARRRALVGGEDATAAMDKVEEQEADEEGAELLDEPRSPTTPSLSSPANLSSGARRAMEAAPSALAPPAAASPAGMFSSEAAVLNLALALAPLVALLVGVLLGRSRLGRRAAQTKSEPAGVELDDD